MTEQQHDRNETGRAYIETYVDHLDYVQSGIETKLPEADHDGVLGVLELGGSVGADNHGFVDTSGSRMILIDVDKGRTGSLGEFLVQFHEKLTPKGSVAAIDIRALQRTQGMDGYTKGVLLLQPGDEPHVLGRKVDSNREMLGWSEQTTAGISAQHIDIRVGEDGVYIRDKESTNKTVLATGYYAKELIKNTPEHHEHVARVKELLGVEAVEDTVELADREAPNENEIASQRTIEAILNSDKYEPSVLADTLRIIGSTPAEIQKALSYESGDEELRQSVVAALGVRMRQLMLEGGHFHHRVQENSPNNLIEMKEGPYKGKQYMSEDYVEMLALAKLDGSFRVEENRNSFVDMEANDSQAGQHRQAADVLLQSYIKTEQDKPEMAATENEQLKSYLSNMKLRFEAMEYPVQNVTGLFDNIVIELQQARPDSDALRQAAANLFMELDRLVEVISAEVGHIDRFDVRMQELGSSAEDMQTIATIRQDVRVMLSQIDSVRQANREMFTLRRLINEYDDMIIIQAQASARQNEYERDSGALKNVARTLSDYINA